MADPTSRRADPELVAREYSPDGTGGVTAAGGLTRSRPCVWIAHVLPDMRLAARVAWKVAPP